MAENPLDVFKGNRASGYPNIPIPVERTQPAQESQQVQIENKEVMIEKNSHSISSVAQEPDLYDEYGQPIYSRSQNTKKEEDTEETQPCWGTWQRIALLVDGAPQPHEPAILTIQKDSYQSTGSCQTSGGVVFGEGQYTLQMRQSNCPGVKPPMSVTYAYQLEEDDNHQKKMTTVTGPIQEVFVQKN